MQASGRNKILLLLQLLMMVLAGLFGLYLASRGLHPRQLRRRWPSRSAHRVGIVMAVVHVQGQGWHAAGEQLGGITALQGENE